MADTTLSAKYDIPICRQCIRYHPPEISCEEWHRQGMVIWRLVWSAWRSENEKSKRSKTNG